MTIDEAFRKLRNRNQVVPRPPRLPTVSEVDSVEERLRIRLPPDFRRYLLEVSDVVCGALEPVTITIPDSHTDLFSVVESAWESDGVPRDLIPICETNGDFFCMDSTGQIVFWSHNGQNSERWPNLAAWIGEVWLDDYGDA